MKKLAVKYLFLLLLLPLVFAAPLYASPKKPTVNVLTWFGYLRTPEIATLIDQECNATLSFDEYYSNDEFLRRWKADKDNYDVVIFANLLYNGIKDKVALNGAHLSSLTKDYHPIIKQHYDETKYPSNVVYFSHSLMGFLWNPDVVNLSETDDMLTVFKKAGKNRTILIDDPIEIKNMINLSSNDHENNHQSLPLNLETLKKLVQASRVSLTSDYNKIYESPDFAFSYVWSGDAVINTQKAGKPYQFLMHPKTSFICTDLLALINSKPAAACVAKVLAGKKALTILQNTNYYFSPYGDATNNGNTMFKQIHKQAFAQLSDYSWIQPVSLLEFNRLEQIWKTLKLEISDRS